MANNAYGIDLGTSNIKIYSRNDDVILVEKNMIAIENKDGVFAYGDSAFDMYEKAPGNISITYPLCNGVIADIKHMEILIRYFISDLSKGNIRPADYYIAVPTDVTEVEKRAFKDLVSKAGVKARRVLVVEKAIADGLGLGIDVKNSQGILLVNVGYDTTEISILSLGGIVLSRLIKIGGLKFDDTIRAAVRKEYSLIIGGKTAEGVKIDLRELARERKAAVVYGRDVVTGLPVEREVETKLVDEALRENFNMIIDNIKVILERTPPELAADIYRHGVYLTGGASQVNHFATLLKKGTGLGVNVSENPVTSVAVGLSKIIKDENYKAVAYAIEGSNR
ncbi:MAG: rod shape-determining protein [Lachnospiraceae bacterium]|jgi:rod shape-determining protein MreB|nr:rod shape-determining protein [Lachnospiraceae bacterium]